MERRSGLVSRWTERLASVTTIDTGTPWASARAQFATHPIFRRPRFALATDIPLNFDEARGQRRFIVAFFRE